MKRTIAIAVLLAAGLALTGCSGGGDDAKPATNEAAETTQAAEPEPQADPEVWSAWATRARADIDGWKDDWEAQTCSTIAMADGDAYCTAMVVTWTFQLTTVDAKLEAATAEDNENYLGPVPDSQRATVDALTGAAADGVAAGDEWDSNNCTEAPGENQCMGTALKIQNAMEDTDAALASLE